MNNQSKILVNKPAIWVGMGTCGIGNGAERINRKLKELIGKSEKDIELKSVGCFGFCAMEPMITIYQPDKPLLVYGPVLEEDLTDILSEIGSESPQLTKLLFKIEDWDFLGKRMYFGSAYPEIRKWNETGFFKGQKKHVLRHAGMIDPDSIDEYIETGGYDVFKKVLAENKPDEIISCLLNANLRGRGGAGYPTAKKWNIMRGKVSERKYLICNADEGDPGAYMNRNEIESDPHSILEGMLIGAIATGANHGIAYVRAEYPLAVKRLQKAIQDACALGLLGEKILGTDFSFDMQIVEGAGAFVCGEETALIASIEGKAGRSTPRPPYPADHGVYGYPTNINNVETWCNIPPIIGMGAEWFKSFGTAGSPGTKVFSLVGKIKNTGLVELPLGATLEDFVFRIGEGTGSHKKVKAVQTGGPSGGCIPVSLFKTEVDYESLNSLGAIMGSGGMVVMDQDNCMVDVARYFLEFNSSESCGKCTPCREGLSQALYLLKLITEGKGKLEDLDLLLELSEHIRASSLCGLGQTASNPILTTLKYFRNEFVEHIIEKRCHAGVCEDLFPALCENQCPLHMNIPAYIGLSQSDKMEEAFESCLRDNPFPSILGRICHFHCQMRCRRESLDQPIAQGEIHRYIADQVYEKQMEKIIYQKLINEKLPSTHKKISIIGAGPAGLTAAYYLIRLGHQVDVYDSMPEAGGMVKYGIPSYRLPLNVLKKEIAFIRKLGVQFHFNTRIGKDITFEQLEYTSDAIFMATGAWKETKLNVYGIKSKGVFSGTELLRSIALDNKIEIGQHVLVIGAGNVALDIARSLWRLGRKVDIIYRREKCDMPANITEILEAEEEGIKFHFMLAPSRILIDKNGNVSGLEAEKMICGDVDSSGRRKPVPSGEKIELECDGIVTAIGETIFPELYAHIHLTETKEGNPIVNPYTMETSKSGIFAGGDLVSGPSTAAQAMGMAKKAAWGIDRFLMGTDRKDLLFRKFEYNQSEAVPTCMEPGLARVNLALSERNLNFREVNLGMNQLQYLRELDRCLRCDIKCN